MNLLKFAVCAILPLSIAFADTGVSANDALNLLKEGNARYSSHNSTRHEFRADAKLAAEQGQKPMAFILSCMDSRGIPEVVFDQSAGSLFVSRVAGNVMSTNMLASMEYAATIGTKLFVVLGHTHCGAVIAGCGGSAFGNIDNLLAEIQPAVAQQGSGVNCESEAVINEIAKQNVKNMLDYAVKNSKFLADKLKNNEIMLVGGIHDINSGKVEFFTS